MPKKGEAPAPTTTPAPAPPTTEVTSSARDDARQLREAAYILDDYGVPASATVLRVVADSIQDGTRKKSRA